MRTMQKSLQLQAFNVDTWWNLIQDMLQTNLQTLFDDNKVYEVSYIRRLKAYRETYLEFKYDSPFAAFEDNFNTSDFNHEASPNGEAQEAQSNISIELRGGDIIEEVVDE